MNGQRIGILGGTFDPIHNGHLFIAQTAYQELALASVVFMPAAIPPHKQKCCIAGKNHRYNMCRLAVEPYSYFTCSDLELRLKGKSYTARTLSLLKERTPQNTFVFIVGADSFLNLGKWYRPELIFQAAEIACAYRDGVTRTGLEQKAAEYQNQYGAVSHILHVPKIDISSTGIKAAIARRDSINGLVPETVYNYMKENGLYDESGFWLD